MRRSVFLLPFVVLQAGAAFAADPCPSAAELLTQAETLPRIAKNFKIAQEKHAQALPLIEQCSDVQQKPHLRARSLLLQAELRQLKSEPASQPSAPLSIRRAPPGSGHVTKEKPAKLPPAPAVPQAKAADPTLDALVSQLHDALSERVVALRETCGGNVAQCDDREARDLVDMTGRYLVLVGDRRVSDASVRRATQLLVSLSPTASVTADQLQQLSMLFSAWKSSGGYRKGREGASALSSEVNALLSETPTEENMRKLTQWMTRSDSSAEATNRDIALGIRMLNAERARSAEERVARNGKLSFLVKCAGRGKSPCPVARQELLSELRSGSGNGLDVFESETAGRNYDVIVTLHELRKGDQDCFTAQDRDQCIAAEVKLQDSDKPQTRVSPAFSPDTPGELSNAMSALHSDLWEMVETSHNFREGYVGPVQATFESEVDAYVVSDAALPKGAPQQGLLFLSNEDPEGRPGFREVLRQKLTPFEQNVFYNLSPAVMDNQIRMAWKTEGTCRTGRTDCSRLEVRLTHHSKGRSPSTLLVIGIDAPPGSQYTATIAMFVQQRLIHYYLRNRTNCPPPRPPLGRGWAFVFAGLPHLTDTSASARDRGKVLGITDVGLSVLATGLIFASTVERNRYARGDTDSLDLASNLRRGGIGAAIGVVATRGVSFAW